MIHLIFNILITALVFIIFGYLLALVYFNKGKDDCALCDSKTRKKNQLNLLKYIKK